MLRQWLLVLERTRHGRPIKLAADQVDVARSNADNRTHKTTRPYLASDGTPESIHESNFACMRCRCASEASIESSLDGQAALF